MRLGWEVLLFAAVIGAAALGHRYVEVAGQRLGRRLARARTPSPGNTSRGIAGETAEPPRKVATFR
jgi:peptidoglycan/LPS O-acetylase OafA/YrhL